jgi:predicted RNA binding protein YcfA (HicA-like mRNA interferase family)
LPEVPVLKPKKLVAALKRPGFYEVRQSGSHLQLKRGNLRVTVPVHPGDIDPRVLRSILRQAHLTVDDLRKAL